MLAKEKFEKLIQLIEDNTETAEISLEEMISKELLMSLRDMGTVFLFLTNRTLGGYIRERKLMNAYRILISQKTRDIGACIEATGYSDQASFTKAFGKMFDMTPKEAFREKDSSKLFGPLTWEKITMGTTTTELLQKKEADQYVMFGLSEAQYEKISRVMELEAVYHIGVMFSNYAYELSDKYGYTLEDAFRYVEMLKDFGGEFDGSDAEDQEEYEVIMEGRTPLEYLREVGDDEDNRTLFFENHISVSDSSEILSECIASIEDLKEIDGDHLAVYKEYMGGMVFSYFMDGWRYFKKHAVNGSSIEEFEYFVEELAKGYTYEEAFEEVAPGIDHELDEVMKNDFAEMNYMLSKMNNIFLEIEEEDETKRDSWMY